MQINLGFDKVKKILHIADVHVRNYQRHKEYKKVFKELYKAVDSLPKESLVYIAGDIAHNKIDMSPELIEMISDFLKNLADRRPTIFIKGNHDLNLNNESRMDALTPIYKSLRHPNLHYLNSTKVYTIGGINFSVFDIADKVENYIRAKDIKSDLPKVALFHGAINSSMTDAGFKVSNNNLPVSIFDGYDLALLGDIHKKQFLNKEKTIHYPGSLIQQNFGEAYKNHGYTIWNMETMKSKFTHIHNDHGFYTLSIDSGVLPNIDDIPKFPKLRLRTKNTTQAELKNILVDIKKVAKVNDVMIIKDDKITSGDSKLAKAITRDTRDVEYQNELISDYIERNYSIDSELLDRIKNLNRQINKNLTPVEISRNIDWQLKKFEFSNMFSYGPNNVVDFANAQGLVGIFAPNHTGKSAILDSIAFCLFDKCSRTKKAEDVMNNKKNQFSCKLNFEIDGIDYFVEKKAKRVKSGKSNVRVDIDFWMIDESGDKVSLNGEQRAYTNKNIRGFIGTYEDFELTALSVQNNNTGFIDKSQTEKKDLLAQFIDITVFEELYHLANDEIRDVQALLRDFKKTDFETQLDEAKKSLESSTEDYENRSASRSELQKELKKINRGILNETKKLLVVRDISDIEDLEKSAETLKSKLEKYVNYYDTNKKRISEINKELKVIDEITLLQDKEKLKRLQTSFHTNDNDLAKIKIKVANKLKLVKALNTHEYDPNCKFCCNNEFVKSAEVAKKELVYDREDVTLLLQERQHLKSQIDSLDYVETNIESVRKYKNELIKINQYQTEIKEKRVKRKNELRTVDKDIKDYYDNKKAIEKNKKTNALIADLELNKDGMNDKILLANQEVQQAFSDMKLSENQITSIESSIEKAHELESRLKAYQYYTASIQRDGVPYELIADTIPYIQEEVNSILSQIVDFTIQFDLDGKNILTFINYGIDNKWPIEMTSGMEKFISSLAIRASLINVSNLPRPNFLAIDEGFGNLDSENLNSMFSLFDYLKTEFDFMLVISHIDALKDATDGLIEINANSSFSHVIY